MSFDFNYYLRFGLVEPIVVGLFFLLLCLGALKSFGKNIHSGTMKKKSVLEYIFYFAVCLFLLSVNIGILSNGGFWLLFEKESDSVIMYGEIDSIEEISRMRFPNINGYGKEITINDDKYISMYFDEFKPGDYVEIRYLPKSTYVLSIQGKDQSEEGNTGDGTVC